MGEKASEATPLVTAERARQRKVTEWGCAIFFFGLGVFAFVRYFQSAQVETAILGILLIVSAIFIPTGIGRNRTCPSCKEEFTDLAQIYISKCLKCGSQMRVGFKNWPVGWQIFSGWIILNMAFFLAKFLEWIP